MSAKRESLSGRILSVLGESPIPVATPDLIAIVATGLSHPRQRVHTQLGRLYRAGKIQCQPGVAIRTREATKTPGSQHDWNYRVMRWKLTPDPQEPTQ